MVSKENGIPRLHALGYVLSGAAGAIATKQALRWLSEWRSRRAAKVRAIETTFEPSEKLLRACVGDFAGPLDVLDELRCPVCFDTVLQPAQLQCGHHICGDCAGRLAASQEGGRSCPRCAQSFTSEALREASPPIKSQLRTVQVRCAGCMDWQGRLGQLWAHVIKECPRGDCLITADTNVKVDSCIRSLDPNTGGEEQEVTRNFDRMRSTGAHFVGRFTADDIAAEDCFSPVFLALGYFWLLSIERGRGETRLLLHPFNGHQQRVRFNIILAKRCGYEAFTVRNWPERCVDTSWGYRLQEVVWDSCLQYDGSVLVMIHCIELISPSEAVKDRLEEARAFSEDGGHPASGHHMLSAEQVSFSM